VSERVYTACALIIGNEILSGRTQDANLSYLASRLNELGIRLAEVRVLPDVEAVLVAAIRELHERFDYVFTTGGIGPTHDDITVECVAKAFEVPVILHPEAQRKLEAFYGEDINEARLRMARAPAGGSLIENPLSVAPGIRMENVFVLAGIPKIMQAQFESLAGGLPGGRPMLSHSVPVVLAESLVAPGLAALQDRFPDVEMGSYPFKRGGRFGTSLVLRTIDPDRLQEASAALRRMLGDLDAEILAEPDA
jgi:molybdenum cofactor synthesis domain-containing protein